MRRVAITMLCLFVLSVNGFTEERGKASWYTGYKYTASGERFRPGSMTAAHKKLPFGTIVRVTRTDTGETTVVRINNRGPFIRGRIIDLTPTAASALNMYEKGVAPVKLDVVGYDKKPAHDVVEEVEVSTHKHMKSKRRRG